MARYAVAVVPAPRQTRRVAIRQVRQSRELTSNAANANCGQQRQDKTVTGGCSPVEHALCRLHAHKRAKQAPHNCFATEPDRERLMSERSPILKYIEAPRA